MEVCPKCNGNPDMVGGCPLCNKTGVVSADVGFPHLLSNYTHVKVVEMQKTLATLTEEVDYIHGKVTAIWNAVKPGH